MSNSMTGVEDKKLQRLLDGAFKDSPLAKELRNKTKYVKKLPPLLDTDEKLIAYLLPHLDLRQIRVMLEVMESHFTGNKEIDDSIRQIFVNGWKGDSIETKIKNKQRLSKQDVCDLRCWQESNTKELLKLVCGIVSKLYSENQSITSTGEVIRYSYKE